MDIVHPSSRSLSKTNPVIYIDGKNIGKSNGTGVYYYALTLFDNLKSLDYRPFWLLEQTSPNHEKQPFKILLYALICRFGRYFPQFSAQNFIRESGCSDRAFLSPDLYRIAHLYFRYYRRLLILSPPSGPSPALVHWTYPLPLLMAGCPNIITIHDLIPLTHPALTGIHTGRYRALLDNLVQKATHFVTVSETVRQEFLSLFAIGPERVTTLYQPVEFDPETRQAIKTAPAIAPAECFIFYGRIETRKNIDRLLEAHARSKTTRPLVLIGPDGDDTPDCTPRGPTSTVIRLPWSARSSLLRCLAEARALVFPTLAEGFGLPIIEAMTLGTAVITSKGGVTEEIAGGAALLVDPLNIEDLVQAFLTLDKTGRDDQAYKAMQDAGYHRAEFFNSAHYRQRLEAFYRKFFPANSASRA